MPAVEPRQAPVQIELAGDNRFSPVKPVSDNGRIVGIEFLGEPGQCGEADGGGNVPESKIQLHWMPPRLALPPRLRRLHRRDALLHLPRQVRRDAEHTLNHHQLAAVMHLVFLGPE